MQWLFRLLWVLLAKAVVMVALILYAGIGLGPDEAQYWTWSHVIDWGYYSKPPAVAWQIGLGTQLFGHSELGVRFLSVVLAFLLSLAVYGLARACRLQPCTAFWAGVVMALSPLGVLASFFAITDVGMVLCWTLASAVLADALAQQTRPHYYLIGLCILCGALFKWPIYLFWIVVLLLLPFYRWLRSGHLVGGILLSLVGLLPSIYWNAAHEWVTFRHVWATVAGGHAPQQSQALLQGNFLDFFGAQMALLSTLLFILLLIAFVDSWRKRHLLTPPLFFCGASCLLLLLGYGVMALFQKVQGNWCDFAYPTGIVFLTWYCVVVPRGIYWLQGGVFLSLLLCVATFVLPVVQSKELLGMYAIPYKLNPFRQNLGWKRLAPALEQAGYHPQEQFLFGDSYQMSSLLSFYGPDQKRAYFLNLQGVRHNQFSFWPGLAQEQLGRSGFFVVAENQPHLQAKLEEKQRYYQSALQPYFREVQFLGVASLFEANGEVAKAALLFRCNDYNGKEPANPDLY